jgi:hypothetical protein
VANIGQMAKGMTINRRRCKGVTAKKKRPAAWCGYALPKRVSATHREGTISEYVSARRGHYRLIDVTRIDFIIQWIVTLKVLPRLTQSIVCPITSRLRASLRGSTRVSGSAKTKPRKRHAAGLPAKAAPILVSVNTRDAPLADHSKYAECPLSGMPIASRDVC